ncbi:TnpV protein [Lachnospiraceae bacterium ZAX-1]
MKNPKGLCCEGRFINRTTMVAKLLRHKRIDTSHNTSQKEKHMANGISYTLVGEYYLPNIVLKDIPAEEKDNPLGRYARMHRAFLREYRPILYSQLLLTERLFPLLRQIDEAANERLSMSDDNSREQIIQGILSDLVYS